MAIAFWSCQKITFEIFLPAYSDRVALKTYVTSKSTDEVAVNDTQSPLMQRLRCKIEERKRKRLNKPQYSEENVHVKDGVSKNRNAEKSTRRVELGWIHFNNKAQIYKQVKSVNGGGTRHLKLDKKNYNTGGFGKSQGTIFFQVDFVLREPVCMSTTVKYGTFHK